MINAVGEEIFKKMFNRGYKVVPVGISDKGYGKRPLIKDWENIDWEENDGHELTRKWFRDIGHRISGLGVLMGQQSKGLACIDIDTDDEEIIERICKYFYSPVMKKGGKGISIFFQTDEKHNRSSYRYKVPSGGIVEIFYEKRQIVIPPSWYHENTCYEWLGSGLPLWEIDPEDLPVFSTDHIEGLQSLIGSSSAKEANINLPKKSQFTDGMNRTIKMNQLFGRLIGDSPNPDISKISNELIIFDAQTFGDNSFFLDPRKAHNRTNSRMANSLAYIASMMKTVQNNTGQFTETMFTSEETKTGAIRFNTLAPIADEMKRIYEGMPEFDSSLIPDIWYDMVEEISFGQGTPRQAIFMSMLTALGASLQGSTLITPDKGDPFTRRTNLCVAMVAGSGSKKTDIVNNAIMELKKIDKELKNINSRELLTKISDIETKIEVLTREKKKIGADVDAINAEIFKLQDELESNKPEGTKFLYENATIQKMTIDAKRNQKTGLFIIKDEMKQIFSDFKKKGNEEARTFYMKGIDGNGSFLTSTISRGDDYIEKFFFSLLTNIQPDVLSYYIRNLFKGNNDDNDGFLQRFILVPFGEPSSVRPSRVDYTKFKEQYAIFRRAFYSEQVNATIAIEATKTYEDIKHEIRMTGNKYNPNPVCSHIYKHEGLVCVIAYLYEYLECRGEKKPTEIGYSSLIKAKRLLGYLGDCVKYLFQVKDSEESQNAVSKLAKLMTQRHFRSGATQYEMFRASQTVTTQPTIFYDALRELEIHGYVCLEKINEKTVNVYINPEVYTL